MKERSLVTGRRKPFLKGPTMPTCRGAMRMCVIVEAVHEHV